MADEELGTGLDMVDGLPARWTFARGKKALANSIARRLQTERGTLEYAPDEGLDVRDLLHEGLTAIELAGWQVAIAREVEKDERVDAAHVVLTPNDVGSELQLDIDIEDSDGETFSLVLNVNKLTVELLEVT